MRFRANGYLCIERITKDEEVAWLKRIYDQLFAERAGEKETPSSWAADCLGSTKGHRGRPGQRGNGLNLRRPWQADERETLAKANIDVEVL